MVIDQFLEILNLISFEVIGLLGVFFAISFFWKNIFAYLPLKPYHSRQRLHQDEIPRIAGLIIYLFLSIVAFFLVKSHYLNVILISVLPIVLIGSKEDLFHNTSPKLRLIMMILSAGLFIFLLPTQLPEVDFPVINQALSIGFMKELFFIFSILVIINGNNLIDGVNGNLAFTNVIQLISLLIMASIVGDDALAQLVCLLLIPLIVFTLFNFPFGKIFCGDTGAYFYGFAVSATIIYLFGVNNEILSWNAVLILIYPSMELLFSFVRKKIFEKKSPFIADAKHLHSLIFIYLKNKNSLLTNNSVVTIYLMPFIASPPLVIYFYYNDINIIIFSIIIFIIMYFMAYNILIKSLLKKD
jgi:UDP-GlcNAc:undecaprenyl-phosphate/decaprenyl-phosphate GlcNAc-1-phosphate transferase